MLMHVSGTPRSLIALVTVSTLLATTTLATAGCGSDDDASAGAGDRRELLVSAAASLKGAF